MNKTTIFKTPSGDEMVVMPRTLYDKPVNGAEMAQDIAAYGKVKARIAAGEEELIPSGNC
jgi:hypothetical protein